MYELNQLRLFMAVAQHGSFTIAAKAEKLSVASVSRSIAQLEQAIDCRLFNRTTRRLNLTTEGQMFLKEVSEGIDRLHHAVDVIHAQRQHAAGILKIAMIDTFAKYCLLPDLPDFQERYPDISLDLYVEDFGSDLLSGGFDVVVRSGTSSATGYISRGLGEIDIVLVASPEYLARRGVPRRIGDLDEHECINLRGLEGAGTFPWVMQHATDPTRVQVYHPKGRTIYNNHLEVAIHAALNGVGIGPSDVRAVHRYLLSGELKIVLPDYRLALGNQIVLLYPHRDLLPVKTRVFIDFVVDVARRKIKVLAFEPHAYSA